MDLWSRCHTPVISHAYLEKLQDFIYLFIFTCNAYTMVFLKKKKLKLFRQIGRTTLKLHLLPLETVTTPKNANHRNSTLGRSSHYILYLVIKGFIQL